jgi:hypothetical protein
LQRPAESNKAFLRRKTCGCKSASRGEKPGEKSRRLSRYGGGWIADAQYLAEVCCERKARQESRELPLRFWDESYWARFFHLQRTFASRLLKEFPVEAVLAALHSNEGRNAYSLNAKWLRPAIEKAAKGLPDAAVAVESAGVNQGPYQPPPCIRPPGLLSRLRDEHGQGSP